MYKPSSNFLTDIQGGAYFVDPFSFFAFCLCHTVLSVLCSLVVTCWERVGSLVYVVYVCFCHISIWFPRSGVVLDCIDS